MGKINLYRNKISKYGVWSSIFFAIRTYVFRVISYFYRLYLYKTTKIDNNLVLFTSTPDFSGNAKALYDYLHTTHPGLRFVWLMGKDGEFPEKDSKTVFVRRTVRSHYGNTLESLRYVAKSKYLFFTHGSPIIGYRSNKQQIVVNLWHGSGFKAMQKRERPWIEDSPFDFALVPGPLFIDTKADFWGCKKEQIWTFGYPRYDYLLQDSPNGFNLYKKLRKDCSKLILWMPTFRKNSGSVVAEDHIEREFDIPLLMSMEDVDLLNDICKKSNIMLCIKRHMMQDKYQCENNSYSNIIFISNADLKESGSELYSFIRYSDALISDYSSVAFDYLLLDKPIAYCLDDYELYKSKRGFVFDNPSDYMPGHHLYTLEDMKQFILDVCSGNDKYKSKRDSIMDIVHNKCCNYSERVWHQVELVSNNKNKDNVSTI